MKKPFIYTLLLLLYSYVNTLGKANPPKASTKKQTHEALAILDKASNFYQGLGSYQLEFTYTYNNPKEKIEEKKIGKMSVKKDKYYLDLEGQEVFCDGQNIWQYSKEVNEVILKNIHKEISSWHPKQLYTIYKNDYKINSLSNNPLNISRIVLIPLRKEKNLGGVEVYINTTKSQVDSIILKDTNAGTTTYKLIRFVANPPLEDSLFVFDKRRYPEDLVLVDLSNVD